MFTSAKERRRTRTDRDANKMENIQNKSAYDTNTINKCIDILRKEIKINDILRENGNKKKRYTHSNHYGILNGTLYLMIMKMKDLNKKVAD